MRLSKVAALAVWLAMFGSAAWAVDMDQLTPEQQALVQKYRAINASLHPVTGDVRLPGAGATLHLGQDYYFLDAPEAKRVLIEAWGNQPEAVAGVLGLVFPAGAHFYDDDGWSAAVTYDASGYVSDRDASKYDYGRLLKQIQDGEDDANAQRRKEGFPAQHLVGWAQPPSYDPALHRLVWARDIQLSGRPQDALNYDMRLLGRRGVLSLNILAGMNQLAQVRPAAEAISSHASFDPGSTYADHQNGDMKAAYGVGGLVAAGLGVAAAQKFGLLAVILLFAKKFIVIIAATAAGALAWVRRMLGLKPKAKPPAAA